METATDLAAEYRARQAEIARNTAQDMLNVAGALNFKAVDLSATGWLTAVESVVARRYHESLILGQDMYAGFRATSGVAGPPAMVIPQLDRDQLIRALVVTGPYAAKHGMALGDPIPDLVSRVYTNTAGVAIRKALAGARDTVQSTAITDAQCIGYTRVTGGKPCNFCAMLAANTYRSVESASESSGTRGRAANPQPPRSKYHNHCQCRAVPIFNQKSWPDGAKRRANEYADLYQDVAREGGTQAQIEQRFLAAYDAKYGASH